MCTTPCFEQSLNQRRPLQNILCICCSNFSFPMIFVQNSWLTNSVHNLTLSLPPSKSHEMSLIPIELQLHQDSTEGRLRVKLATIAHLSRPWSIGWVALSFLVRLFVCLFVRPSRYGNIRLNLRFFNIYRHTSLVLTQFHLKPSSTKLYWPSTTKYQPVTPHIDLAQQKLTRTAFYWPSILMYQAVPPHTDPMNIRYKPILLYTDPVPSSTNKYYLKLTQNYQVTY